MADEYGVLRGRAVKARAEWRNDTPHYQLLVETEHGFFRAAINVKSNAGHRDDAELLYLIDDTFRHAMVDAMRDLRVGFTPVPSQPNGLALDYVRGNLFDHVHLRRIPAHLPGPMNDLNDGLDHLVQQAIRDPRHSVFVFGTRWGPEHHQRDEVFGFTPGNGVHDIHMRQGNSDRHRHDNGVWHDGGVFFHSPDDDCWTAVFLAFQSQSWQTDERGDPIHGEHRVPRGERVHAETAEPLVRIIAAVVSPEPGNPAGETVTLLNTSPEALALDGWELADKANHRQQLSDTIGAGTTRVIRLARGLDLSSEGGTITLFDDAGLKVDGVAYTRREARRKGWTIAF